MSNSDGVPCFISSGTVLSTVAVAMCCYENQWRLQVSCRDRNVYSLYTLHLLLKEKCGLTVKAACRMVGAHCAS